MFTHVNHLTDVPNNTPTFLAIGSFDGVHRGHQAVLQRLVSAARTQGTRSAVLTFFPHPKRIIQNLPDRYYITRLEDRVSLLAALGLDLIITQPFTEEMRRTRAAHFIDQLCQHLSLKQLWGGNFALGYNREGDVPFLRQLGQEKGYTVEVIQAMAQWDGELISSSRIRHNLIQGDILDVNGCLGRPFHLTGEVVTGAQRGRTIGFPTANLTVWHEQLLPANGVYATYAWVNGQRLPAATNVGVRPTVDGHHRIVESHLLDFDGDLYGTPLKLEFVDRIRAEKKFAGLDALKAQIQADIDQIRQQLHPSL